MLYSFYFHSLCLRRKPHWISDSFEEQFFNKHPCHVRGLKKVSWSHVLHIWIWKSKTVQEKLLMFNKTRGLRVSYLHVLTKVYSLPSTQLCMIDNFHLKTKTLPFAPHFNFCRGSWEGCALRAERVVGSKCALKKDKISKLASGLEWNGQMSNFHVALLQSRTELWCIGASRWNVYTWINKIASISACSYLLYANLYFFLIPLVLLMSYDFFLVDIVAYSPASFLFLHGGAPCFAAQYT